MSRKKKWILACSALLFLALISGVYVAAQLRQRLLGPEAHYFDSAGLRIHYTDEGEGTPVVLAHGFSLSGYLHWGKNRRMATLAKDYRVITLDFRGHGRSDKPHEPGQYGLQMVEDLVRLLDHLGIEKAHLVGYSMGGFITLKMLTIHPERLLSAAVCGAGWEPVSPENQAFTAAIAQSVLRGDPVPLQHRLGLADKPLSRWDRFLIKLFFTRFNDPLALAAVARASEDLAVTEEELGSNTVPTLTIIGSKDGLLPGARTLSEKMERHELLVLEGKHHMNTDGSAAFRKALQDFLAKNTPG